MKQKQIEQLRFIEIASDLNQEIYEKYGETDHVFYYSTDGYADIFMFNNYVLWTSEIDDREFIEDINDYEDFKPYIIKVFNKYIESIQGLSL